jgi:hypothetical protein
MIKLTGRMLLGCSVLILCSACASNTFTQQGEISTEKICYQQTCYTTIYWEDGSISSNESRFLPDTIIVYRHCHFVNNSDTLCRDEVYEQPIILFNQNRSEAAKAIPP